MKLESSFALFLGLSLASIACEKKADSDSTGTSTGATFTSSTATTAATAVAATSAAAPKSAFVQKGINPGKAVVGYMVDVADGSQCAVVTDDPAKKDAFAKDADKLAAMMKAKVATSCPTDKVVGTCDVGLGMLTNYSGPTWTAETAKKQCLSKPRQSWLD